MKIYSCYEDGRWLSLEEQEATNRLILKRLWLPRNYGIVNGSVVDLRDQKPGERIVYLWGLKSLYIRVIVLASHLIFDDFEPEPEVLFQG